MILKNNNRIYQVLIMGQALVLYRLNYFIFDFPHGETEEQRQQVTCLRAHSQ